MSLNAAVTPDGGEIGRAQLAQAEAARVAPARRHEPDPAQARVGLGSQVVVLGRVVGSMRFGDYQPATSRELREIVGAAFDRLRAATTSSSSKAPASPAEVNLREGELVNMWMAERAEAPVVLVADIERGGALAAIVGTLALLEPDERARVQALVINKFRGDRALFADGVRFLEERTGVPRRRRGAAPRRHAHRQRRLARLDRAERRRRAHIAIVRLPHLSNFDEFEPLAGAALAIDEPRGDLAEAALVILPGTKCTVDDLAWLRRRGLGRRAGRARATPAAPSSASAAAIRCSASASSIPHGVESRAREVAGLAPACRWSTRFARDKVTEEVRVPLRATVVRVRRLRDPLRSRRAPRRAARSRRSCGAARARSSEPEGCRRRQRLGHAWSTACSAASDDGEGRDRYDALADHFEAALDMRLLDRLAGL